MWRGSYCTQTQARKIDFDPSPATKARLLSFNRTQSRVVTDYLTGHNTLRIHLYVMGLSSHPACRTSGKPTESETSAHVLCACEALASFRRAHLGSFYLDPEDIMSLSTGTIWNFGKETGLF